MKESSVELIELVLSTALLESYLEELKGMPGEILLLNHGTRSLVAFLNYLSLLIAWDLEPSKKAATFFGEGCSYP